MTISLSLSHCSRTTPTCFRSQPLVALKRESVCLKHDMATVLINFECNVATWISSICFPRMPKLCMNCSSRSRNLLILMYTSAASMLTLSTKSSICTRKHGRFVNIYSCLNCFFSINVHCRRYCREISFCVIHAVFNLSTITFWN